MEQKKFVKFGLSAENLKKYVGMIEDETINFFNKDPAFKAFQNCDPNGGDFHCFQTMSEITILTASRTLQGREIRDNLDKSFADMYHDLDGGFTPINVSVFNVVRYKLIISKKMFSSCSLIYHYHHIKDVILLKKRCQISTVILFVVVVN